MPRSERLADELRALAALLLPLKQRFPAELQATVLAEPEVDYERLVQVMGTVRATAEARPVELFPRIAIGDAPLRQAPGRLAAGASPQPPGPGRAGTAPQGGRT